MVEECFLLNLMSANKNGEQPMMLSTTNACSFWILICRPGNYQGKEIVFYSCKPSPPASPTLGKMKKRAYEKFPIIFVLNDMLIH